MDDSYNDARRVFEAAYREVIAANPSREDATKERKKIVDALQVQAVAKRVPDALRPIYNGRAAAYLTIIER